jgi:molybdopterin-containing oxidoreductase family iron-sulfur binding subunit
LTLSLIDPANRLEAGSEEGPEGPSRRQFLKWAGFAFAGATLAGCQRAPVQYALPYLLPPENLIPGRSYDYASTCGGCSAGCGLLVKNRDGRPIKLEGNPEHPLSRGGLCAAGQASLLGLYDQQRLQHPMQGGQPADWPQVDKAIGQQLDTIRKQKGAVRFLTGPVLSPTTRVWIGQLLATFADGRQVVHDPRSCSALLEAHARTHGARLLPHYRLAKAEVLVGFDADFLGTWISPVEYTAAYQAGRGVDSPSPRYHVQFESRLTLTGSKADRRLVIAPQEMGSALNYLAAHLAGKAGVSLPPAPPGEPPSPQFLDHLADLLWQHRQRSLVVCGSQDVDLQVLCNFINHVLDNYGTTVDLAESSHQREGNDQELQALLQEIHDGKVAALFIHQSNPVHDLPAGEALAKDLQRVPLVVNLAPRLDETAQVSQWVCPDSHYLESWNDAEAINGLVSVVQPAITPLAGTRSVLESLAAWIGKPRPAYDLVREHWEKEIFPRARSKRSFQDFWDHTLQDGFAQVRRRPGKASAFNMAAVRPAAPASRPEQNAYTLLLYPKVALPDASHAYNPWLQELPDPISKVTWDNYVCLSPAAAAGLGATDGDVVRLESTGEGAVLGTLELPAFVQPGMHDRTAAVALGYGSILSKRFEKIGPAWLQARPTVGPDGLVGKNSAGWLQWVKGNLDFIVPGVRLTRTGDHWDLASTQGFDKISVPKHLALPGQEIRPIIREVVLGAGAPEPVHADSEPEASLWPEDHPRMDPRWGMTIDLAACTGCSACVIACQAENNIPVVGKDEVRRHREMHWLRIDRYYTERGGGEVDVAHQPMLCQQCGNAPCEVVCPVLATVHSEEGLNEQVYNRCVGTRYCANNCPYKVRRFNWFDYAHDDLLQNLVLNPDVTVRSRGVMEKCTFCVQRIERAKIEVGRLGRRLADGDVQTACQQSCPARAITFGNLHDAESRVSKLAADSRSYQVLGELNIRPSVNYLALVRNRSTAGEDNRNG